jgi:hypothetical protein
MTAFIMLLIYEMKSVDGQKNSGVKIIDTLLKKDKDKLKTKM